IDRRAFMRRAVALSAAGAAAAALGPLALPADAAALAQQTAGAAARIPLDVAEWSYMWVNVKRAETARGAFVGGQQMYVEYMIPAQVRHPFPVVLVHGGFPAQALTLESIAGRFTPPNANPASTPNEYQKNHNQWPGPGNVGSDDLARLTAGMGGSYVVQPAPAAGRGGAPGAPGAAAAGGRGQGGGRGEAAAGPPPPANQQPAGALNVQHLAWRQAGAELLDKIGPAIIMTHSAGGPFGLLVAEARPNLVKATIIIEGAGGSAFGFGSRWGLSTIPVTYDPPVNDPAEIKTKWVANPEPGIAGYYLQEEPARKLPNLKNTRVLIATADSSFASPGSPGAVAFLKQAGVQAEELRWGKLGMNGNGHAMMMEKNSRQVLQPLIDWMHKNVTGSNSQAPAPRRTGNDSLALKLGDAGMFWVGTSNTRKMPYGTIHQAPMFVQYFEPAQQRHPLPLVLVHGGGGQMVHYFGLGGMSGWAH